MFFKYLFLGLIIYLLYRFFRIFFVFFTTGRKKRDDFDIPPQDPPKKNKIIDKDEGEYVEFEEIDDDKE